MLISNCSSNFLIKMLIYLEYFLLKIVVFYIRFLMKNADLDVFILFFYFSIFQFSFFRCKIFNFIFFEKNIVLLN